MLAEINCANHPDRAAIEHCEVCGKALCGYCLYYTEDGQRLCEQHAHIAKQNGMTIIPPAVYAEGIIPAQAEAKRKNEDELILAPKGVVGRNRALYQGNNIDLQAFIGMGMGVLTLASCCGATYCLPFAAVIMGIMALMNAKDAVDPRRTRQQGMIAIATGGIFALGIVACIGFYVFVFASAASVNTSSFGTGATYWVFPTSTVTVAPASTDTPRPQLEPSFRTATAKAVENKSVAPAKDTPTKDFSILTATPPGGH